MSVFWPSDININDTQSPREILQAAQEDWLTGSQGLMQLTLQDAQSESGNSIIMVYATHVPSKRTSTLLSIVSRPEKPYPVNIQIEGEHLPNFLKKSYTKTSVVNVFNAVASGIEEREISNPWIADTPAEFRAKLGEAFNSGSVKSKVLNLASNTSNSLADSLDSESQDSSIDN